jgi:hypothetical protein
LQENSKLYHYLATFEEDFKRKLAMEARRLEFLNPIIKSLNRIAFEVLHKQVSLFPLFISVTLFIVDVTALFTLRLHMRWERQH